MQIRVQSIFHKHVATLTPIIAAQKDGDGELETRVPRLRRPLSVAATSADSNGQFTTNSAKMSSDSFRRYVSK